MITNNEYLEQAQEFLKEASAKIDIKFLKYGNNKNWDKEDTKRKIYEFTIANLKGSYTGKFYGSISEYEEEQRLLFALKNTQPEPNETQQKIKNIWKYKNNGYSKKELTQKLKQNTINEYDILASLDGCDPYEFEEFCENYGYDTDSRRAEKIYNELITQYLGLIRIFTTEQLEKLQQIN